MATNNERAAHREVLPVPDLPRSGLVTFDAKNPDSTFAPIEAVRPPEGAPNVLVVMLDDWRVRLLERVRRPVRDAQMQ